MLFPLVYLEIRSLCKLKISEQPGKIFLNREYSKQPQLLDQKNCYFP